MIPLVAALQDGAPVTTVETGIETLRLMGGLVVVAGVLALFLWLLKRGTFKLGMGRGGRHGLAVESALSLGDRRSLVIVTVEGKRLLLGLSPTQVALVTELSPRPASFEAALDGALDPQARSTR